jgi:hypothetical protein
MKNEGRRYKTSRRFSGMPFGMQKSKAVPFLKK